MLIYFTIDCSVSMLRQKHKIQNVIDTKNPYNLLFAEMDLYTPFRVLGIDLWMLNLLGIYFFNWVFVKFILGNTILSPYFLLNDNHFTWVSMISNAVSYPSFEKQLGIA